MIASVGIVLSLVIVGTVELAPSTPPEVALTKKSLAPAFKSATMLKLLTPALNCCSCDDVVLATL